eukprot:1676171-Ditylum_brightwellii.AAC.1
MPHVFDLPTDGSDCHIVLTKNNRKEESIRNTSKYDTVSDWTKTGFAVIANILYKNEQKD